MPGWHIECSAMVKILKRYPAISTGGDHSVHHENKIAQCKGTFGYNRTNFWMRKFLLIDNKKYQNHYIIYID